MTSKHDTEIRIEKELSRLSASFESLEKKIDEIVHSLNSMTLAKDANHVSMWNSINDQRTSISWMKGIFTGVQIIWAVVLGLIGLHKS